MSTVVLVHIVQCIYSLVWEQVIGVDVWYIVLCISVVRSLTNGLRGGKSYIEHYMHIEDSKIRNHWTRMVNCGMTVFGLICYNYSLVRHITSRLTRLLKVLEQTYRKDEAQRKEGHPAGMDPWWQQKNIWNLTLSYYLHASTLSVSHWYYNSVLSQKVYFFQNRRKTDYSLPGWGY